MPSNTNLTVVYRQNGSSNVNVAAKSLNTIQSPIVNFNNYQNLDFKKVSAVVDSLEAINDHPITGDTSLPSVEEIKYRAYGMASSQSRAVTREDYLSLIYNMPPKFGSIKRAAVIQDTNSFKRNLNIYVISEDNSSKLINCNSSLKNNLKTWLSRNKMINDTIDILDAKIVNYGIEFEVISENQSNKFDVLNAAIQALVTKSSTSKYNIGESIRVGDFYKALKDIDGLLDVVNIRIVKKTGTIYSSVDFNINDYTSLDGRLITLPMDYIFEIKYPTLDIVGKVK